MATRPSHGLLWGVLFRVEPGRPAIGAGLRVAAATTVPLFIGLATSHLTMGAAVSLGALNVAIADSGGPEGTRIVALSVGAVVFAGAFALGVVSARTLGLAVPLMFAIAFAGGFVSLFGGVATIMGFVTTVVYILGLGFPAGSVSGPEAFWLALVGGVWAMLLALAVWPLRPYGPAQDAVAACYVTVGRLVSESCLGAGGAALVERDARVARDAQEQADATLRATRFGRAGENAPGRVLAALAESAGVLLDVAEGLSEEASDTAPLGSAAAPVREACEHVGEALRSVGSAVRAGARPDLTTADRAVRHLGDVVQALRAEVGRGAGDPNQLAALRPVHNSLRRLLDGTVEAAALATDLHEGSLADARRLAPPTGRARAGRTRRRPGVGWMATLGSNLTLDSVYLRHALRYAFVTTAGVILFRSLDLPKGYWVPLTIAVILKPFAGTTLQRTLLRVGGTILGALLAVAIIVSVRSDWAVVLAMVPLAVIGFALQPFNYALWLILFTPLVILTTEVAHPGQWTLAGWRVADTLTGAALALVGGYLLWPGSSRRPTTRELGAALAANRAYFCAVMRRYIRPGPTTQALDGPHRRAAVAADNAEVGLQRLLGERPGSGDLTERYWRLVGANRRVYGALTALESHLRTFTGRHPLPGLPELFHRLDATLADLADALGADRPPAPLPELDQALAAVRDHLDTVEQARARERTAGLTRTPLVEELRDETLVGVEAEHLVRGVRAMHSALGGSLMRSPGRPCRRRPI